MGGMIGGILGTSKPDTSGQERAAGEANALEQRMYEEGIERAQPFYTTGVSGNERLADYLGLEGGAGAGSARGSLLQTYSPDQLTQDPGYQFRLAEGNKALERSLAAGGKTFSPEAAKALQSYGQNMASQEYGAAFDRNRAQQTDIYNRLAGISGSGQTQAAQMTSAGQNYAGNVGQTNVSLADSIAAGNDAAMARRSSMFGTGISAAGAALSDERLKENIKFIRKEKGHNIYHFNYKDKEGRYEGVMAQEVKETNPDAVVVGDDGFMSVYYDKLGLEMKEVS